jgi:WD40 repeat protein
LRTDHERPIHQGPILACAFLGGPERLASASVEGAIAIWDTAAGQPLRRFKAHDGPITTLAWDGARRRLVSGGHDRRIVISDVEAGVATARFALHDAGLFALAISPDGEVLASGGYDRVIRLWRLSDGTPLGVLRGHERAVTDLDFLVDGRLASSGRDYQVIVWAPDRCAELYRTAGHARWAMRVRASADGNRLFSVGEDGQVCCWDARTGERVWRHQRMSPIWGLERTPDGRALIVGMGGGVLRCDLGPEGVSEVSLIAPETARAMARCETGLMALGADKILLYRSAAPDAPVRRLDTGAPLSSSVAAIRWPATSAEEKAGSPPKIAAVITRHHGEVLLDLAGRRQSLDPPHAGLAFAACAIGDRLFATAGFDGKIHLRRAADGGHVRTMDHEGFIFTIGASADGTRLLTAGNDRMALWDVATGHRLWAGRDLGVGFHCWATLSPDGGSALMVGEGPDLHRWSFADEANPVREGLTLDCGRLIGTCGLMGVAALDETAVAIATAAGEIRRADLATGRTELLHARHESGVRVISLSPDRRRLLSFSENSVAAVYDLAAGRLCTPAAMASAAVPAAAFTASGDLVWVDGEAALHLISAQALDAS